MKNFIENLANLIKVKTIVTLVVITVFAVLALTGAISADEYEDKSNILDRALSRFIEGTYNDYALSRLISQELIESEFPETSFSAGLLTSLLDEPKEAQLAYELLKSLKEGK